MLQSYFHQFQFSFEEFLPGNHQYDQKESEKVSFSIRIYTFSSRKMKVRGKRCTIFVSYWCLFTFSFIFSFLQHIIFSLLTYFCLSPTCIEIDSTILFYQYLQNVSYFQLPTVINTNISSVFGWSPLMPFNVNPQFIPQRIPPVFVGDSISQCISNYHMDKQVHPEYTFLRNSIMLHAGFYITPEYFLQITQLNRKLNECKILQKVQDMTSPIDFTLPTRKKRPKIIENGIAIQHPFAGNYYHILLEILPMFFLLDRKIFNRSHILYYKNYPVGFNVRLFHLIFDFFGLYPKAYTDISRNPILVKNLLIFKPRRRCLLDHNTILYMRKYIFSKYYKEILESQNIRDNISSFPNHPYEGCDSECEEGVEKIMKFTPFRFVFLIRHYSRTIRNRQQLIDAMKERFPKITFEVQPLKKSLTIAEQMIFYHQTILLMGMHEAGFANILFMLPKTVVIEFAMNECYHAVYTMTQLLGLHLYSLRFNYTSRKHSSVADIPVVLEALEQAVKTIDRNFNTHYSTR